MVMALKNEWSHRADERNNQPISSLYFGGGTPSLLNEFEFQELVDHIVSDGNFIKDFEFTVEVNPDDVNAERMQVWKKAGVNRLSVGIQSLDDHVLQWMNRAHSGDQARRAIYIAKEAGIHNISVDFIYGHGQYALDKLLPDLMGLIELQPTHLSAYALTVEHKTTLHHQVIHQQYTPLEQEKVAAEFLLIHDTLSQMGMHHYELSNYAFPGKESFHNSQYWKGAPYQGIGPSAHSFNGKNKRSWNLSNNAQYLKKFLHDLQIDIQESEILTPLNQANEYWMTGLRTAKGIEISHFIDEWGLPLNENQQQKINKWYRSRHLNFDGNGINCTPEGWMVMDAILSDVFF